MKNGITEYEDGTNAFSTQLHFGDSSWRRLATCTLVSGCGVLDSMVSEKTKECKAKGGQMEPTKGFYVWRGPNEIDHVFDYECSVK